jgi:hypothetical protein
MCAWLDLASWVSHLSQFKNSFNQRTNTIVKWILWCIWVAFTLGIMIVQVRSHGFPSLLVWLRLRFRHLSINSIKILFMSLLYRSTLESGDAHKYAHEGTAMTWTWNWVGHIGLHNFHHFKFIPNWHTSWGFGGGGFSVGRWPYWMDILVLWL